MRIHRGTFLYLTSAIGACHDAPPAAPAPVVISREDVDRDVDEIEDDAAPAKVLSGNRRALEAPASAGTHGAPRPECASLFLAPALCERLERALSLARGGHVLRCIIEGSGTVAPCMRAWTLVADGRRDSLVSCLGQHGDVEVCLWGHASVGGR
jgi:hypothetical protein